MYPWWLMYIGMILSGAIGLTMGEAYGTRRERGRIAKYLRIKEAEREEARTAWRARGGVRLRRAVFKRQDPSGN